MENLPEKPASEQNTGPVAGNGPATALLTPTPSPSAREMAPKFGGLRDGRPRADGLIPGSPEAKQRDREKDAERKRNERAAKRAAAEPPPLPSAQAASNPAQAPSDNSLPVPGLVAPTPGPVPWEASTLKPLFDQLIPTIEALTGSRVHALAEKARLPLKVIDDIDDSAKWPDPAKKALAISAPQVAAKWMNKTGVSAENQPELVMFTAIGSIAASHMMVVSKLEKLIAAQQTATVKPEVNT